MHLNRPTLARGSRSYAGMGVSEARELRQLREENAKLKQLVADLSLDKHMLQEVIAKKLCGLRASGNSSPGWAWRSRSANSARAGWCTWGTLPFTTKRCLILKSRRCVSGCGSWRRPGSALATAG